MNQIKEPNWDGHFQSLERTQSPIFWKNGAYTMFSQDRKWLYIKSYDIGVPVFHHGLIALYLKDMESEYRRLKEWMVNKRTLERLTLLETDIDLLKDILGSVTHYS